jgi:hypothetical protein
MRGPMTYAAVALTCLLALAAPARTAAGVCDSVPDCEGQVQTPEFYIAWQTSGWAYYCTGDHPYYWNNDQVLGFGNNFTWDDSCFTVTENPFAEDISKMDATITNWCLAEEFITVTIGCSRQPQGGPSCPNGTKTVADPGCPMQGNPTNHCSGGTVPFCFQTWIESCSNGLAHCTADAGLSWCTVCQ